MKFKDLFFQIAEALGRPAPVIAANKFLTGLAWRGNKLINRLFGGRIIITQETAQSSQTNIKYSNQKIKEELGTEFIPVTQSIRETATLFLRDFS